MVKVGDKIRILRDYANCATVGKGDIFIVGEVLPCGDIRVINRLPWRFGPEDFEVIHTHPPQKIQQDGYEYELVGPVKPDWLVDGAWVVDVAGGQKLKVVKSGECYDLRVNELVSIRYHDGLKTYYRPHTPEDFKWGDWAMYEGKRVFVMTGVDGYGQISVSHPDIYPLGCDQAQKNFLYVPSVSLTPTF